MNPLFAFPPETSHKIAMVALDGLNLLNMSASMGMKLDLPVKCMGLDFANPVGLAAGLDKNGDHIDGLGMLGFGFIELGTITPKPQLGNPKPRLFRLTDEMAIINRMGFNNKGVDHLAKRLQQKRKYKGIVGVNIGKNKDTPLELAYQDYQICIKKLYAYSDYITINISSPNTQDLRKLQNQDHLGQLLSKIQETHLKCAYEHKKYKPLILKVAPDLKSKQLHEIAIMVNKHSIDGVIVSNTTLSRNKVSKNKLAIETGGLSGAPLFMPATKLAIKFRDKLNKDVALIGSGGIMSAGDAKAKLKAGTQLIQLYTGFVYKGTKLLQDMESLKA